MVLFPANRPDMARKSGAHNVVHNVAGITSHLEAVVRETLATFRS